MRLVLDTSVLIDHLRGRPKAATEIIPRAIARGDELWSSYVVRAELLAGMRGVEDAATRELLRLITWVDVDEPMSEAAGGPAPREVLGLITWVGGGEPMSEAAGALGRRFLSSHPGIEVADLIVAALVQHLDAELKTTNVKHFPMFKELTAPPVLKKRTNCSRSGSIPYRRRFTTLARHVRRVGARSSPDD